MAGPSAYKRTFEENVACGPNVTSSCHSIVDTSLGRKGARPYAICGNAA